MKKTDTRSFVITISGLIVFYGLIIVSLINLESHLPGATILSWQDGLWYVIATITTVGYGDVYPVTHGGRIIGFVTMLSSLGVYGFIIGQIANFMSTLQEQKELGLSGTNFKNHVVIIGWNDFGQSVIKHLIAAGKKVAVVTKDRTSIEVIHEYYKGDQVFTLYSDYNNYEMIEKSNIQDASIVFVNLQDDTEKLVYIIDIRKKYPHVKFVVTLDNGNLKGTFINAGATYTISKNDISAKLMASYIYEPDVALFSEEIMAYAHEDDEYDLKQILIKKDNPFLDTYYDKAFFDLKKSCNVILVGIVKNGASERKFIKNPDSSVKIEKDDYLVVMLDGKGYEKLAKLFHISEGL